MFRERYGPWAVVTGASDGIGREMAIALAQKRCDLVVVARRKDVLDALGTELRERHGVQVRVVPADLSHATGVAQVVDGTASLDVGLLVAAAGFGTSGPFLENGVEDELAMVDVNCRAVVALCHHFGGRFAERGRGGIVLMSSLLAFQGVPRAANYAATKAFIQSFAEGLQRELAPAGVDVIASAPGPIHSGFARRARMTMTLAERPAVVAAGTVAALGRRNTVRPGWLSKVLEGSLMFLPRRARIRILARVMSSMARPTAT